MWRQEFMDEKQQISYLSFRYLSRNIGYWVFFIVFIILNYLSVLSPQIYFFKMLFELIARHRVRTAIAGLKLGLLNTGILFCSAKKKELSVEAQRALWASQIIQLIREPSPSLQELAMRPLRKQILDLKAPFETQTTNFLFNPQVEREMKKLMDINQGVTLSPLVFSQERFSDKTTNKNKKVTFCPTHIVTGVIFNHVLQKKMSYQLLYGRSGVGKSLSLVLLSILMNEIAVYKYSHFNKPQLSLIKHLLPFNKKIVYWSMGDSQDRSTVAQILLSQIKQAQDFLSKKLEKQLKEKDFQNYQSWIPFQRLKQQYRQRQLELVFVVDQVNLLASLTREYNAMSSRLLFEPQVNQQFKKKYDRINTQLSMLNELNEYVKKIAFSVFYNSSANIQTNLLDKSYRPYGKYVKLDNGHTSVQIIPLKYEEKFASPTKSLGLIEISQYFAFLLENKLTISQEIQNQWRQKDKKNNFNERNSSRQQFFGRVSQHFTNTNWEIVPNFLNSIQLISQSVSKLNQKKTQRQLQSQVKLLISSLKIELQQKFKNQITAFLNKDMRDINQIQGSTKPVPIQNISVAKLMIFQDSYSQALALIEPQTEKSDNQQREKSKQPLQDLKNQGESKKFFKIKINGSIIRQRSKILEQQFYNCIDRNLFSYDKQKSGSQIQLTCRASPQIFVKIIKQVLDANIQNYNRFIDQYYINQIFKLGMATVGKQLQNLLKNLIISNQLAIQSSDKKINIRPNKKIGFPSGSTSQKMESNLNNLISRNFQDQQSYIGIPESKIEGSSNNFASDFVVIEKRQEKEHIRFLEATIKPFKSRFSSKYTNFLKMISQMPSLADVHKQIQQNLLKLKRIIESLKQQKASEFEILSQNIQIKAIEQLILNLKRKHNQKISNYSGLYSFCLLDLNHDMSKFSQLEDYEVQKHVLGPRSVKSKQKIAKDLQQLLATQNLKQKWENINQQLKRSAPMCSQLTDDQIKLLNQVQQKKQSIKMSKEDSDIILKGYLVLYKVLGLKFEHIQLKEDSVLPRQPQISPAMKSLIKKYRLILDKIEQARETKA